MCKINVSIEVGCFPIEHPIRCLIEFSNQFELLANQKDDQIVGKEPANKLQRHLMACLFEKSLHFRFV